MSLYELLLFVHIAAAIAWIGSGFMLLIQAAIAERAEDEEGLRRAVVASSTLATKLFIPASLTVLVAGVLLVIDGPWSFGDLWIVLGLAGYAATFVTGITVFEPRGRRVAELTERNGGVMDAEAMLIARKMLTLGRIDYVVLVLVVAIMAIKPTGDDAGVLAAMAAILIAGVVLTINRARSIGGPRSASPAPAG